MTPTVRPLPLIVLALLLAQFSEIALAGQDEKKLSEEYSTYLEYLTYQRQRISLLDPNRRESAQKVVSELAPKFKDLDIEPIRKAIVGNATERNLVLSRLQIEAEKLPEMALVAQAELAAAKKSEEEIDPEKLDALATKAELLRQRSEFVLEEQSKFLVGAGVATKGANLYWAVLALEEKRIEAGIETDQKKKRIAEAVIELQEKKLGGETLDTARLKLERRDASLAARKLMGELKMLPRKIDAMARHPVKRDTLREVQKLYQAESEALVKQVRGR